MEKESNGSEATKKLEEEQELLLTEISNQVVQLFDKITALENEISTLKVKEKEFTALNNYLKEDNLRLVNKNSLLDSDNYFFTVKANLFERILKIPKLKWKR